GLEQYQIAHHHRSVSLHRLECGPTAERKRRADRHPVERHLKIRARKAIAMDVTGYGSRPSQSAIDLFPVDVLCLGTRRQGQHYRDDWKEFGITHQLLPFVQILTPAETPISQPVPSRSPARQRTGARVRAPTAKY